MRTFERNPAGDGSEASEISRVIASVLELLDMDVVYVSEFADGRQVFRAAAGDVDSFDIELGTGPKLDATYDQRMVTGELPR